MQARLYLNIGKKGPEQENSPGNKKKLDSLLPVMYDALHRMASSYLRRERSGHNMETAALVHDAYLRLVEQKQVCWNNGDQLLGLASRMMRCILVDHVRSLYRAKHGGGTTRVPLDEALTVPDSCGAGVNSPWVEALGECLASLAAIEPQQARIVELRYFGGLTTSEIANVLDLSTATVTRRWRMARSWLFHELTGKVGHEGRATAVQGVG